MTERRSAARLAWLFVPRSRDVGVALYSRCFVAWNDAAGAAIILATVGLPPSPQMSPATVSPARSCGALSFGGGPSLRHAITPREKQINPLKLSPSH